MLREFEGDSIVRQLLECGSLLPLFFGREERDRDSESRRAMKQLKR